MVLLLHILFPKIMAEHLLSGLQIKKKGIGTLLLYLTLKEILNIFVYISMICGRS